MITLVVNRQKTDHREEEHDVAGIDHAFLNAFEMSHDAEGRDRFDEPRAGPVALGDSVTGGQPRESGKDKSRPKRMKLTTWLRVIAEVMAEIDK